MAVSTFADQAARERIRNDLGHTLFVEAGAGTGKTTALVGRILRLVASGRAELRRIAAITFTEAAAAELRDRVREALELAVRAESDLPTDERRRCQTALTQVDAAAIQTLHSFAQRILAEHPLEAGLPPLLDIQDDVRASIAFEERWQAWLDEALEDEALEPVLLRGFTLGMSLVQLRGVAEAFHENWDRMEALSLEPRDLLPVDVSGIAEAIRELCALREHCLDPADRLAAHLERLEAYWPRLAAAPTDRDRLRVLAEDIRISAGRAGQQANWEGVTAAEVRDRLKDVDTLRANMLAAMRAALLPSLLAALRRLTLEYADERRRLGRLEFHDLLVMARNLLRRDAAVRQAVRRQFTHLLIDEFQDTDPLQIEIAVLLGSAANEAELASEDEPPAWSEAMLEEGRLFFVGDPKQSIYRFRRADIALYQAVQERFGQETVRLTQNFRSLSPVIKFANHVFEQLMGDGLPGAQAPHVPLEASWPAPEEPVVTVVLLGGPLDEKLPTIRDQEAGEIVQVIGAAKAEGWPVMEENAAGERVARLARFADVALLLPTRTALPAIESALESHDIPYRVESRSLIYDSQEVRDLLAILRALDDPTDEVAIVAAIRSPAFGCADDDLVRYSRAGGRWDYRQDPQSSSLLPHTPVVQAMVALRALHERCWWEGVSGIVEAVARERGLFELAFAQRRPRERWQRLRFVLDQARAFEEAGGGTLRQFVDWAERQAEEGTAVVQTVVPERDDDAVRIMTVHASKGLEFPIVVLAGLNVAPSSPAGHGSAHVLWDAQDRPEVRFGPAEESFETSGYAALAQHEQDMQDHEQVRLLYVAATRARDHLVLSLHHKKGAKCHAARLFPLCQAPSDLWRSFQPRPTVATARAAEPPAFDDSPERRQAWLQARQQRLAALGRVPAIAATALARQAQDAAADPGLQKDPPPDEAPPWRRGRAGTALGRAVHAVLQSIDLATGEGLAEVARAQALAEGIPHRADQVARMVAAALASPSVQEAVALGRYWRELYVAAPIDGVLVEGFVDLLYHTPQGLVVLDYKTDLLPACADLEAALSRHRLQGAAYALAIQEALGQPVTRCVFLFLHPSAARERAIADLPEAMDAVREAVRRLLP